MGEKPLAEPLADQAARDRIRNDLDTSLVVEAAAGTGKTTELVTRIVAVIKGGRAKLDRIVAVTFTDAAAGELKLRVRTAIERERQDPDCPLQERQLLNAALPQLEEARIGTIHSFCGDLLRERPVEAGIDPLFEVASDEITRPLFGLAFDRWFEGQLANPGEGVRRILRRRPKDEGPKGMLRHAARALAERRDFPAPWQRNPDFDREAKIDVLMAEMKVLAAWADSGDEKDFFVKSLKELKSFVDEISRTEAVSRRDYDGIEARLTGFVRMWHSEWVGFKAKNSAFPKEDLLEKRKALKEHLDDFIQAAGADLAPRLRDELWTAIEQYERLKERAGCLDFLDLLLRARDLVRDNSSVRTELQRRFTHVFVDEFQDTDPLQAEILTLLAADDPEERDWRSARPLPGKLFIVGDPKQSIYRFRRADVALYEQVKQQVTAAGGALLNLNVSFRAVPEIQEAVNAAFAPVMARQGSTQARYVPLLPRRTGVETQPTVIALPVPDPYSNYGRIVNWMIDKSLPDGVAAFVDWLVHQSGWTVTEREQPDNRVPVQARHVCLLFRRFRSFNTDVTRPYVRALEARRLPHLLVGGTGFHTREEVEALRNALGAIERPDDELAIFATLKGPLFALSDAQLLSYRDRCRSLHTFKQPPDDLPEALNEVVEALAILRELHRERNRRPISDTIGRLLATTRAHAGFANWTTGEQALANVSRLMDMARRAERSGMISFRSFVDWLTDQAESGEASDAPIIEEGVDGVRIMTVHKAKGLEFPVVILADLTAREAREPSQWSDPSRGLSVMKLAGCAPPELQQHAEEEMQLEREEAARVLYVAATRARDLLVVSAVGDRPFEGWLGVLNPAIYPPAKRSFQPETNHPPGCPELGEDNVARRAPGVLRPGESVTPGLHKAQVGEHRVVWWDPNVLELGKEDELGSRLNKLLAADERAVKSQAGIRDHEAWQAERVRVREYGQSPSLRVAHATAYAVKLAAGASPKETPGVTSEETRVIPESEVEPLFEAAPKTRPGRSRKRALDDASLFPPLFPLFDAVERAASEAADDEAAKPTSSVINSTMSSTGSEVSRGEWPEVMVETVGIDFTRPHGKRFGILVHAILSLVDLEADRSGIEAVVELQGRVVGATSEEVAAATETVARAFEHPLLKRAAVAFLEGRCRRETPVAMLLEDGTLVEGKVDLAFVDDSNVGWTVVDFKTDFEILGKLEEYRNQVGIYAQAISRATGSEARGVLLRL
ncbi:MAG TPA: UvrD-helicase domain-containing protein [Blastocatellia bacterium]|nr:UvrD-helicase domain-containing protein [Blastocatellia bacterium]